MKALSLILICLTVLLVIRDGRAVASLTQSDQKLTSTTTALNLIQRQQYNQAISRLEEILEADPNNGEALTFMATARLYQDLHFTRAKREFNDAFRAGGGGTFFVNHSHEKLSSEEMADYCRGWLHIRKNVLEYVPLDGNHNFRLTFPEVGEFKQNRFSKSVFHIKVNGKNQNFRGRTSSEMEVLLIVALYKDFIQLSEQSPRN